jgi:hypothetical protein
VYVFLGKPKEATQANIYFLFSFFPISRSLKTWNSNYSKLKNNNILTIIIITSDGNGDGGKENKTRLGVLQKVEILKYFKTWNKNIWHSIHD